MEAPLGVSDIRAVGAGATVDEVDDVDEAEDGRGRSGRGEVIEIGMLPPVFNNRWPITQIDAILVHSRVKRLTLIVVGGKVARLWRPRIDFVVGDHGEDNEEDDENDQVLGEGVSRSTVLRK